MSEPALTSVIIPLYNGSILIRRCLDSVFDQAGDVRTEVIVVDDGSTDNSIEVAINYPKSIKLLKQENHGPAAARNRGIEAATGKYLAFLDVDDYWLPDFLKETVRFLVDNPEVIAVSTGQLHKIPGKPDTITPAILKTDPEKYRQPVVLPDFFSFWAEHNHVCTGSVLMRTDIVKKTGGQRPELRVNEDIEFWAYLATYGPWGFIPKVLFVSDGGVIVKSQGWKKYKNRLSKIPDFEQWFSRIDGKIDKMQHQALCPVFNRVIEGQSRAMLVNGEIVRSRRNILSNHSRLANSNNLHVRLAVTNGVYWYVFGMLYRFYQHFKIRILSKLGH